MKVFELANALRLLAPEQQELDVLFMDGVRLHEVTIVERQDGNEFGTSDDFPHIRLS